MTRQSRHLAALAGTLLLVAGAPSGAFGQVAVNPGALNQLQPEATQRPVHPVAPHRPPVRHPAAPEHRATGTPVAPSHPAATAPVVEAPRVPAAPPNAAAVPPPAITVPTAPMPPPPPIPVADDAPGAVAPMDGGVRITFGKDRSDLNPAMVSAIQQIAAQAKAYPGPLDLTAFAAGSPDNPSTPRRLSLARALAVRAVLLREGIPSPRIYVRAEGTGPAPSATPSAASSAAPSATGSGDAGLSADRVDLVQEHAPERVPEHASEHASAGAAQAAGK